MNSKGFLNPSLNEVFLEIFTLNPTESTNATTNEAKFKAHRTVTAVTVIFPATNHPYSSTGTDKTLDSLTLSVYLDMSHWLGDTITPN